VRGECVGEGVGEQERDSDALLLFLLFTMSVREVLRLRDLTSSDIFTNSFLFVSPPHASSTSQKCKKGRMTNTGFLKSAAEAVKQANMADTAGEYTEAITLFTRALHHYRSALQCERNVEAKCLITEQVSCIISRIRQLQESDSFEEEEGGEEVVPQRRKQVQRKKEREVIEEEGKQFHEELRSLKLSGEQLAKVKWDSIIGLDRVKQQLLLCTKLPLEMPHLFTGGMAMASSLLLYGPPGVGKTQIMRALAYESGMAFFPVSTASLISKYVGDSAKYVRALFEVVKEAKPCILFIDEIDALCLDRESGHQNGESTRAVTELLIQMDGITREDMTGVVMVGATNLPWKLDAGVLRRLTRRFYVPMPDVEARLLLLRHYLALYPSEIGPPLEEEVLWRMADLTNGYSGSDIANLVNSAYQYTVELITEAKHFKAVRMGEDFYIQPSSEANEPNVRALLYGAVPDKSRIRPPAINEDHLRRAMVEIRPSVDPERVEAYESWTRNYGTKG